MGSYSVNAQKMQRIQRPRGSQKVLGDTYEFGCQERYLGSGTQGLGEGSTDTTQRYRDLSIAPMPPCTKHRSCMGLN